MNFFVFPKAGQSVRGFAVDRCALCMEVSKGRLVGIRNFIHLGTVWIPGPIVGTVFDCERCGGNYGVKLERFDELVPAKIANEVSFLDLLKRTNRALFLELATERKLRSAVAAWKGQGPDPRQMLARFTLSRLVDQDGSIDELNRLVDRWPTMNEPARHDLLLRIEKRYQKEVYKCRVDGVCRRTAHAFVAYHVFAAPFVGLLAVFLGFGVALLLPEGWHGLGFFVSFVAGWITPIAAYLPLKRLNYRYLFSKVLLKDARKSGVKLEDVVLWMKQIRKAYRQKKLGRSEEAKRWYNMSKQATLVGEIATSESLRGADRH